MYPTTGSFSFETYRGDGAAQPGGGAGRHRRVWRDLVDVDRGPSSGLGVDGDAVITGGDVDVDSPGGAVRHDRDGGRVAEVPGERGAGGCAVVRQRRSALRVGAADVYRAARRVRTLERPVRAGALHRPWL